MKNLLGTANVNWISSVFYILVNIYIYTWLYNLNYIFKHDSNNY